MLFFLLPATALAHESDHHAMDLGEVVRHVASQPGHMAMLALFVLIGVGWGWRIVHRSRR